MYRWSEEIPREEYTRLFFLEKTFRWVIKRQLSKITIPPRIWNNAKKKKRDEESKGGKDQKSLIYYISFSEYKKIIVEFNNWTRVFQSIFKNKQEIGDWLELLTSIRNKVAHMKPLNLRERENLEKISQHILIPIWETTCNRMYVEPAQECIKERKYQEAEELLIAGLKETDEDPWITYNLGILYEFMERLKDAEKQFEFAEKNLALPQYKEKAKEKLRHVKEKIKLKN